MNRAVARFAWYRFRRTWHHRWGAYVAVTLLIALVGGLALGALAGARRTQSAFPNYLASTSSSDLQVQAYFGGGATVQDDLYNASFTKKLARLPDVSGVSASVSMFISPLGRNGLSSLPPGLADNEVNTIGPINGEYYDHDRMVADKGRLPNPERMDEIALTADAATLLHWHVGEVVPMGMFTLDTVFSSPGAPTTPPVLRIEAKVVGIVALNDSVVHDEVDRYPTFVLFTPAFTNRVIPLGGAGFSNYDLRLAHGAADVTTVEHELINTFPPGTIYNFHVTSVVEGQLQRASKPESIALGAFGGIAALAALLIAGQAISRAVRANRQDLELIRAVGASPTMMEADSLLGMLGAIVIGAIVAAGVCVAISPFSPIGTVRQVDPAPGFNFDWTVLAGGLGLFIVALGAIAIVFSALAVRRASLPETSSRPQSSSRIVSAAARAGFPPASIAGIRFAVERGSGANSVPVGSALIGAALAVVVVVATLTFASGLSTLVSHPALYGWNWNYAISEAGSGQDPPVTGQLLSRDKYVASWTGFKFGDAQMDGVTVPLLISRANAPLSPPILSGHRLQQENDVVLGGTTLAQLHKHVGDTVVVSYGLPKDYPVYLPPTKLKIVGTTTLPAIGSPGALHPSMGTGALVGEAVAPAYFQQSMTSPDPNLNGPAIEVVKLRSGVSHAAALASLERIANTTSNVINQDPNSGGGKFQVLSVQQPAEIVNYKTIGATPAILASGLAVGAVVALGLTLVASVRRRRRDLALLKTLGFLQRQLAAVVSWQASVAALVGIIVGVPLGAALGRELWTLFAHEIFAVPQPTVPALQVALVAVGALVLANVVALVPGRIAARTPTGVLLRAE